MFNNDFNNFDNNFNKNFNTIFNATIVVWILGGLLSVGLVGAIVYFLVTVAGTL